MHHFFCLLFLFKINFDSIMFLPLQNICFLPVEFFNFTTYNQVFHEESFQWFLSVVDDPLEIVLNITLK